MRTPPLLLLAGLFWPAPALALAPAEVVDVYGQGPGSLRYTSVIPSEGTLVVEVSGLQDLLATYACTDLRLVLNERQVAELQPSHCDQTEVTFSLRQIDRGEDETWLNMVQSRPSVFAPLATANVTLAPKGGAALPSAVTGDKALSFELASFVSLIMGVATSILVMGGLVLLGRRSAALRDPRSTLPATERPYSLSKVQMAWWMLLVLMAFIFVTSMTGGPAVIPVSILSLIGITLGTVAGDQVVDKPTARSQEAKTRGFFPDLITNRSGDLSLTQFQTLIWTVVVGVVFVVGVLHAAVVVPLDATLVALMGMSATGYVGLKAGGNSGEAVDRQATAPVEQPKAEGEGETST